jgi:predicted dehydrogenase
VSIARAAPSFGPTARAWLPLGEVVRWRELGHAAEQVVAIASRTRSLAEKVAADFNIPVVYDSLAEMLADAELDAVINATPGPAHYATSMEILSAGKHLITDKPLASTVAEADQRSAPWPQRTTS